MQHQAIEPPEALRDVIKDFWYISRDFDERQPDFEVTPDGYAEIIFYFGSACSISTPNGWQLLPSPFLVGLLTQPILFRAENRLEIIGIKGFPWAIFELLNLPPGKGGVRVMEHPIAQLQAALATCLRASDVAGALAQVMQYCVQARPQMASNRLLADAGGALPVSQVAAAAHSGAHHGTHPVAYVQASGGPHSEGCGGPAAL